MAPDAPGSLLGVAEHWCAHRGTPLKGDAALTAYADALRLEPGIPFLEAIIENIPDMIFVKDAEELRFRRINRAGERLLGMTRAEMMGKNDYELFPPSQAQAFVEADREVLESGRLLDISEETIQTRDGERVLHTKKIPIRNAEGQTTHLLGISEDITAWKQVNDERVQLLEERAARGAAEQAAADWALLAQVSSHLAASLDLASSLSEVVRMLPPRLGDWAVIELHAENGEPLFNAVHHIDPASKAMLQSLQAYGIRPAGFPWAQRPMSGQAIATGEVSNQALDAVARDASHRSLLERLRPRAAIVAALRSRNRTLGCLTVARTTHRAAYEQTEQALINDLADRLVLAVDNVRLHEEAQQAIRARDEFLAVAAHELKTPLTTLQLDLQKLMRNERAEGKSAESGSSFALGRADRQVQRLSGLVNDLLDVTRLGAESVTLQREEFDLCTLVAEMTERMDEALSKTQSVLRVQAPDSIVGQWDRLRLSQVITNLLSNALKYGAGGPIEVQLEQVGQEVAFRVSDHGIGIAPEHHARIFGPFQRAVSERHYGGLGLGLWIANRIVAAHHGRILLQSEMGQGATFTVVLPLRAEPA